MWIARSLQPTVCKRVCKLSSPCGVDSCHGDVARSWLRLSESKPMWQIMHPTTHENDSCDNAPTQANKQKDAQVLPHTVPYSIGDDRAYVQCCVVIEKKTLTTHPAPVSSTPTKPPTSHWRLLSATCLVEAARTHRDGLCLYAGPPQWSCHATMPTYTYTVDASKDPVFCSYCSSVP